MKKIVLSFMLFIIVLNVNAQVDTSLIDTSIKIDMNENLSKAHKGSDSDSLWIKAQLQTVRDNIRRYELARKAIVEENAKFHYKGWVAREKELVAKLEKIRNDGKN